MWQRNVNLLCIPHRSLTCIALHCAAQRPTPCYHAGRLIGPRRSKRAHSRQQRRSSCSSSALPRMRSAATRAACAPRCRPKVRSTTSSLIPRRSALRFLGAELRRSLARASAILHHALCHASLPELCSGGTCSLLCLKQSAGSMQTLRSVERCLAQQKPCCKHGCNAIHKMFSCTASWRS